MQEALGKWLSVVSDIQVATSNFLNTCAMLQTVVSDLSMLPSNYTLVADALMQAQPHIDTIEWVETSLRESRSAFQQLRNTSPALVPTSRLPAELLSRVFRHVEVATPCTQSPHFQRGLQDVVSVCSTWRRVAIATHSLWSHIDIYSKDWGTPAARSALKQVDLRLQRASGVPIHFHLPYGPSATAFVADIIPVIQSHMNRVASITVHGKDHELLDVLLALCNKGTENILTSITARTLHTHLGTSWRPTTFPRLRALHLADLGRDSCPSLLDVLNILSETPLLHTLQLRGLHFEPDQLDYHIVSLPRLTLLDLSLSAEFLSPISSALYPGGLELDVRLNLSMSRERVSLFPVQELLTRSNVVSLMLRNIPPERETLFRSYLSASPHLRSLILRTRSSESYYVLDELVSWILESSMRRLVHLQALCLIDSRMDSNLMYKIQCIVSAIPLKHLCFVECSFSPDFKPNPYFDDSDEDMEADPDDTQIPKQAKDWLSKWMKKVLVYEHDPSVIQNGQDSFIQGLIGNT